MQAASTDIDLSGRKLMTADWKFDLWAGCVATFPVGGLRPVSFGIDYFVFTIVRRDGEYGEIRRCSRYHRI